MNIGFPYRYHFYATIYQLLHCRHCVFFLLYVLHVLITFKFLYLWYLKDTESCEIAQDGRQGHADFA